MFILKEMAYGDTRLQGYFATRGRLFGIRPIIADLITFPYGLMCRLMDRDIRFRKRQAPQGVTLIELMIVTAILATLAALTIPLSESYVNKVRVTRAIGDIRTISLALDTAKNKGSLPGSLDEIGYGNRLDPWGRPYEYLNLITRRGNGTARKDHHLAPLNGDYDLYSRGSDGQTASAVTAKASQDDIIRADNGGFIGLGSHY